jgi:hypothetical protein
MGGSGYGQGMGSGGYGNQGGYGGQSSMGGMGGMGGMSSSQGYDSLTQASDNGSSQYRFVYDFQESSYLYGMSTNGKHWPLFFQSSVSHAFLIPLFILFY